MTSRDEAALLAAPARRAERRIRLGRALEWGVSALSAALVAAIVVLVLRKTGHLSERTARLILGAGAAVTALAALAAYLRPLAERAGAVALDRYHVLSDRLSSALAFLALPVASRTPFMEVAIADAVTVVGKVDPRRAVPFRLPRDAGAAFVLGLLALGVGLFEVRKHEVVVAAKTIDAVDVTADDLDAMRDFLKDIQQKSESDETKAATEEFNQLIADLAAKRLDRTEAFRRMQALEDKLLEGSEADHKALEAALAKIGEEMKKAELTRPAGTALSSDHLADAEKALKELADRLRKDAKEGRVDKAQLDKMREALKRAAEDSAKNQAVIAERREELQQQLLKEKKRQAERDGGASEEDKSLLQKKERELERLEKEQEAAQAGGRQLDRLDRELAQAAEDLLKDLGATADDLDKGAEDINRMAQQEMSQEEKEQLKQKIDELREMIRQQGQGGQGQMVRLRRFQAGARGQGQSGQGQSGEGQEGQGEGQEGEQGQQGQNGQGNGQQGQGQQGHGQRGQGQNGQGQNGQGGEVQQGEGPGGQTAQGQMGGGAGGETWIVGPNGEKILMLSRGGAGAGMGQGNGGEGGGGAGKGSHGWGTGHDEHVQGQAHGIKSGTQDTQVAGQDTGQGSSRSEVIQGAAERGFTSRGYQKVYREYHTVAEEALAKDEIPGGYRSYVRRYFELIRPRDQQSASPPPLTPAPPAPANP